MRAKDVMSEGIVSVLADASVFEAAEIMVNAQVSAVPVIEEDGKIVGILSEADLIRRAEIGTSPHKAWLQRLLSDDVTKAAEFVHSHSRLVRDVMTKNVITVDEESTLSDVAELMAKHNIKRVPVLREGSMVGILSRANLIQALMSREPATDKARPSDEQLRREVTKAVDTQPWCSAWPTNVVVSSGVVHLWGFTHSEAVRKAYRVAAENVPGVKKVKNHMRMVPASVNMGV
jgi:CBS-domain-containing membrane protein